MILMFESWNPSNPISGNQLPVFIIICRLQVKIVFAQFASMVDQLEDNVVNDPEV